MTAANGTPYYRARAYIYECTRRSGTKFFGPPRADQASALQDARRWVSAHVSRFYGDAVDRDARRRLRTLLRTDPAGALKQFNNDLAPMLAAVWVERRRLGTSRQGARLDAIREAGREE